jgi:group I intron endonuclease
MITGLYSITHKETGKMYIGQSKHLRRRFARHKRDAMKDPECNGYISRAIAKYGPDAFEFKILVVCQFGDYLNDLERNAIASYGTLAPAGYNLSLGGFGGSQLSEEVKLRRRSRPAWNKGIPQSDDAKRKQSITMTGRPNPNQGKPVSDEQKRKQSAAMKGRKPWNKGIPLSEEQKQLLRLVDRSYTKTPEYRAKMSAAVKAAKARGAGSNG